MCSVKRCDHPADSGAAGMCHAHRKRVEVYGDPRAHLPVRRIGQAKRFLQDAIADGADECLPWPFARNSAGYAHLLLGGRYVLAHRYICEKCWGPAPPDKPFALHTCGNGARGCIAPRHLKWGDHEENMADMIADGRSRRGEKARHAKLSADLVRAIRAATGTQQAIADRFGVSQTNVSQILLRKTWTHVT